VEYILKIGNKTIWNARGRILQAGSRSTT
jgi:hypothetical protein